MGGAFLRIVTDSWTGYFSKGASSSGYTQKLQVVVLEPCKCKIKKKILFIRIVEFGLAFSESEE